MTAADNRDASSGIHAAHLRCLGKHNAKHRQFDAVTTLSYVSHEVLEA